MENFEVQQMVSEKYSYIEGFKPRLLVVDDEPQIRTILSEFLADHFTLSTASNGKDAIEVARKWKPDLILMDVMMPEMDGVGACRALRENEETRHIPVLMLTAANMSSERVRAFDSGADDFISKPFDFDELVARLHGKYRRAKEIRHAPVDLFTCGNLTLNPKSHEVKISGGLLSLSPAEYGILKLLLEHVDEVVTRKDILKSVWEDARRKDRLIDAHVTSLRKKIDHFSGEIQTLYGLGYKIIPLKA
jgi:DNA-binding response OmpR family regulator